MHVNVSFDSSVTGASGAPAGFVDAVNYVANLYGSIFTNNVTITIAVGFGNVGNQTVGGVGASGLALDQYGTVAYSDLKSALTSHGVSSGSLPAVGPSGGIEITVIQARALGFTTPTPVEGVDGYVGFSNSQLIDYGIATQTAAGAYSFVGAVEHEFSEVMGRRSNGPAGPNTVLDLYRYSSSTSGSLTLGGAGDSYFSVDQSQTHLSDFNTPNPAGTSDYADWADGSGNDAFLARGIPGATVGLTGTDLSLMRALGWQTNVIGTGTNLVGSGETDLFAKDSSGALSATLLNSSGIATGTIALGSGPLVVNGNTGGVGIYLDHSNVLVGSGGVASITGISNGVSLAAGASLTLSGRNSNVTGNSSVIGSDFVNVTDLGNSDTVRVGAQSHLISTGNNLSALAGAGSTVTLPGSGDLVTTVSSATITVGGSNNNVNAAGTNSLIAVIGNSNTIAAGSSSAVALAGTGNTVTIGASS